MSVESERYRWSELRSGSSAKHVPDAIAKLARATTSREAYRHYWRIDNTVVVQGAVYEAALPTLAIALLELPTCTRFGLGPMLELVCQICWGDAAPSEVERGNAGLVDACNAKLRATASTIYSLAPRIDEDSLCDYADVLFTLVEISSDPALALWHAWTLANQFPDTRTARNIARWSLELQVAGASQ